MVKQTKEKLSSSLMLYRASKKRTQLLIIGFQNVKELVNLFIVEVWILYIFTTNTLINRLPT